MWTGRAGSWTHPGLTLLLFLRVGEVFKSRPSSWFKRLDLGFRLVLAVVLMLILFTFFMERSSGWSCTGLRLGSCCTATIIFWQTIIILISWFHDHHFPSDKFFSTFTMLGFWGRPRTFLLIAEAFQSWTSTHQQNMSRLVNEKKFDWNKSEFIRDQPFVEENT